MLLVDLQPGCCKWPVREASGSHWLCAEAVARVGLPYCRGHMGVAFPKASLQQTTAERLAMIKVAATRRGMLRRSPMDASSLTLPHQASIADSGAPAAPCGVQPDPPALGSEENEPASAAGKGDNLTHFLRPVAPLCIQGVEAHTPPTGEPIFERVNPCDLLVDEAYQRDLSPKSIALIKKIVAEWDWRRFKPPVVAFADHGLQIIDGQHTAIAAACHPGVDKIPVMVVEAPELAARANAFIGHNRDRLQVSAMQLHHAAVAAGDELATTIEQVCKRAGVTLVRSAYGSRQWKVGETQAINAVRSLVDKHSAQKARQILEALVWAGLAPIAAHDVKAAEMLFTVADYVDQLEPIADGGGTDVANAIMALGDGADKEARVFAAAQCVPYWRALGVTWFKKARKRRKVA